MHFDFTINVGQIGTWIFIFGAVWRMERVASWVKLFLVEHEMLIGDYCDRNKITPSRLPTRAKGLPL